jgi:hypothetical protein
MMDSGCGSVRRARITTACSGRDMDKVPKAKRRQRAADAGRYALTVSRPGPRAGFHGG